jgi:hypothetical protein
MTFPGSRAFVVGGLLAFVAVGCAETAPTAVSSPPATVSATSEPPPTPPAGGVSAPPSASASPVAAPSLQGSLACHGTDLDFPADVLGREPNAELAPGPAAAALRAMLPTDAGHQLGLPARGWRLVTSSATEAIFLAPTDAGWAFASTSIQDGTWQFQEGGACDLRVQLPKAVGFASWRLDPGHALDPKERSVAVLAQELACASGKPPVGRVLQPIVLETTTAVTIAIAVRHAPGDQDCQSTPEFPLEVTLRDELGGRALFDGSTVPPAPRN